MPRPLLVAVLSLMLGCTGAQTTAQPQPAPSAAKQRVALPGSPNGLW